MSHKSGKSSKSTGKQPWMSAGWWYDYVVGSNSKGGKSKPAPKSKEK